MVPSESQPNNRPKRLADLPEETRKTIFFVSLITISVLIAGLWILSLKSIVSYPEKKKEDEQIQKIKNDISKINDKAQELMKGIDQASAGLKESQNSSTSPLIASDIEKLKEKILEKQTDGWRNYENSDLNFSLKYPTNLLYRENVGSVISFIDPTDQKEIFQIKKFPSQTDLTNLPGVKKSFVQNDYLLALIDLANNTTTQLMLQTFKLINK
jgi:hypothetical protein